MTEARRLSATVLAAAIALPCAAGAAAESTAAPQIARLKALHLETSVVRDGAAGATIVVPACARYDAAAGRIAQAVRSLAGAAVPIAKDDSPAAGLPLGRHVIVLGNRSTNALLSRLYDRFYTLLDLRYPGEGGWVVRTLHNPFGNGCNAVLVGGSDDAGVDRAADALIRHLRRAAKGKSIRLGRLADIHLPKAVRVPTSIREVKIWDASAGYRSTGYFGWNSLSKRMALYYMTGDASHAREFLRLAFPDAKARREIAAVDGERIEDKDHPLSGPYHYNAHLMILLWDLIEESPAFSDAERLRVTRAFAAQLDHWRAEGWAYAGKSVKTPRSVGSRHHQWAAVSLYCLARYFQRYYPHPTWQRCLQAARAQFRPLHEHAWVSGENDNLWWYNTAIAPILTYLVLTGDRAPLANGVLAKLLRGQEILASGRVPDWALRCGSIGFFHKAAYLTGDGRWLTYRDRTGVDLDAFRVGQSYWPPDELKPKPPDDLVGRWTVHRLPRPKWKARRSGLGLDESFEFASYRSRPDAGGDFVLIDGFNGASRNPYHAFAVYELRLGGYTLLRGYRNQLVVRVDGLMEPTIAMDAALKACGVLGETAYAVAEVPKAAFANWRRTLVQRVGRYALIIDELTFRKASANAEVRLEWEPEHSARRVGTGQIVFGASTQPVGGGKRRTDRGGQICAGQPMRTTGRRNRWTMRGVYRVSKGERKTLFSLIGMQPGRRSPKLECYQIGADSAAVAGPAPALVAVGADDETKAALALLAGDRVFALSARRIDGLLEADRPVDVDWDLTTGAAHVACDGPAEISLAVAAKASPALSGKPPTARAKTAATAQFRLPAGKHVVQGAVPPPETVAALRGRLRQALERGRAARAKALAAPPEAPEPPVPPLEPMAAARFDAAVADIEIVPGDAPVVAAAVGRRIHLLALDGKRRHTLAADGAIRMLRWWPQAKLLLAGCADEKVIAFDLGGGEPHRRWVFVSQMDPAVVRAAKTYWFKSAPGHEGIHGLHTGELRAGTSWAFVGSACTLEVLDPAGKCVHRMPLFWGKNSTFAIVGAAGGGKNLLVARKHNGTNNVSVVSGKTLKLIARSFLRVPPGHTYVGGWSSMNRHHLFYEDLDGDGRREVISEINGTWNRVVVWTNEGKPLHAANFGPGPRIPARTMLDLDVCDLDGDGRKEIVASTSYEMVVALDAACGKRWARRLPAAANVLACVRPQGQRKARIVLGCNDARVRILDAEGKLLRSGAVAGRPAVIRRVPGRAGLVVIGTSKGQVAVFDAGAADRAGGATVTTAPAAGRRGGWPSARGRSGAAPAR